MPALVDPHDPHVVVPAFHVDQQPALGELLGDPGTPLDDGDGVLDVDVEIQVVDLGDPAEPVGVDVHHRHPAALVHPGDDERG